MKVICLKQNSQITSLLINLMFLKLAKILESYLENIDSFGSFSWFVLANLLSSDHFCSLFA